jgi:hypothetical protein
MRQDHRKKKMREEEEATHLTGDGDTRLAAASPTRRG